MGCIVEFNGIPDDLDTVRQFISGPGLIAALAAVPILMNATLHHGTTATRVGAGIFFLGYVLFEVPSNLLLERYGARRWIARILITWANVSTSESGARPWLRRCS